MNSYPNITFSQIGQYRWALTFTVVALLCHLTAWSQTAREEIAENVMLSGYYLTAYPGPLQDVLSPPPAGKTPFYISHYGRHGSRWMNNESIYNKPIDILQTAFDEGVLSPFGQKVLSGLQAVAADAAGRYEELTPIGLHQWQDIGKRMTKNFPEVFSGSALIDARSTIYSRCILSMSGILMELKAFNPHLRVEERASERDMPFLLSGYYSQSSSTMPASTASHTAVKKAVSVPAVKSLRLTRELINDSGYIAERIDTATLFTSLMEVVSSVQNSELGDSITLYDVFTDEELYQGWRQINVKSYNSYHKGTKAKDLLRRMIDDADTAIAKGDVAAHLRFGHEIVLLPAMCLMGLNGLDQDWDTADEIEAAGWRNYHLYPMAGNLQVIFYRSGADDPDILVKVLLNEREALLPLPSDTAPYYRWNDVRSFWLSRAQ
jgi:hypothetical protein